MPPMTRAACIMLALFLIVSVSMPTLAAPASVKKTVQTLENGNFLIKIAVTSSSAGIYAFQLKDPKGAIIDVYAPKGWCILSDGEVCLSRTGGMPIVAGKTMEFMIYSTVSDAQYVWTFFGPMEQIGKSEVL